MGVLWTESDKQHEADRNREFYSCGDVDEVFKNFDENGKRIQSDNEGRNGMDKQRQTYIQALRDFADFLENNPQAAVPRWQMMHIFIEETDAFRELARRIRARKTAGGEWFHLEKIFGPQGEPCSIEVRWTIARAKVCERKVIGVETVPAQTKEIVEWHCTDSLLAPDGEEPQS